ncbi:MAG: PBP1A family penicillin-binding protein [Deltaproteobacteria bacterium]|nr:PBP1A family penicillin-binding protein [Deltaproteobacteria bacterium]
MNVVYEGEREKGSLLRRATRLLLFLVAVGGVGGLVVGVAAYSIFAADVPNFESIDDYRPKTVSRVFGQEGQLIGEFYRERRLFLPYDQIPPKLVQAFLASEDDRFFEHQGIDYWGIIRAAVANMRAGRVVQGGSTITQQVAKSLIISVDGYKKGSAKKYSRKIREAILASRLEKKLSKPEILTLYLNQIFLGNQAYGVQAAAQNYFRKNVGDMNVAEMALLAGLPQAPSRYSPFRHPKEAKDRREYVLRRMLEEKFITEAELIEAKETPIEVFRAPDVSKEVTPYFTEHVRRQLFEMYGEDKVLDDGLTVYTTVDVERYRAGEDAIYDNLRMVDKRQGYRGPVGQLKTEEERKKFLKSYSDELQALGRYAALKPGELYVGLIKKIDRTANNIYLDIGPHQAFLPLATMRWAREVDPNVWFERGLLSAIPKTFKVGDLILVRATTVEDIKKDRFAAAHLKSIPDDPSMKAVALEQEPNLETALLSVESKSGYVLTMIGGYSFDRSEFNRALQSCRQPGSSFKPIIYSAAITLNNWTASTTVLDAPVAFDDPEAQKRWKPNNFDTKFMGEVTLRTALQNSMNVPAIRVLDGVGIGPAIQYAKRLGITTELRPELGLALGASCVTMGELTDVYQLFSNYGKRVGKRFITRVIDRDGKVLYDDGYHKDPWAGVGLKIERSIQWSDERPTQVIDPQDGFLAVKLMRNVVLGGTGTGAQKVGVPVAGKTGTTNDSFDAWFMGFTTDITTAAWVGYDDYVIPMGRYEQGGRAALPVWTDYMKVAIKKKTDEFDAPAGVVYVRIDPKTGMRAREDTVGAVTEAFKEGNEPADFVAKAGEARPDQFFMQDN